MTTYNAQELESLFPSIADSYEDCSTPNGLTEEQRASFDAQVQEIATVCGKLRRAA